MVTNELIFLGSICTVSCASLIALALGSKALIALICVQAVLVNLFVTKQITLFGLTATASEALAVGTTLALNLLQEYYHKAIARKTIWLSIFCSLFYTIMSVLHITYLPAATDSSSQAFLQVLAPMPRIVSASLTVYVIVQYLDTIFYAYFQERLLSHHFIIRNYSSLALSQLIDTILFTFLGLYGINESFSNLKTLFDIIVVSYIIKLLVIIVAVPFVRAAKSLFHITPPAS